ncbi:hypothetical protein [Desulfobacter postgatei]|jgi:hypothetical protein|uniref:hypothetical protein n=1 Tax=Desulfobacter postgatei TaxID=2293 RepID=UPI002A364BFD|nr:hypothetical protein [Desulfobacter postgatei]MDX9964561.1 hypothetical protein [Desulfobacter postgatei]
MFLGDTQHIPKGIDALGHQLGPIVMGNYDPKKTFGVINNDSILIDSTTSLSMQKSAMRQTGSTFISTAKISLTKDYDTRRAYDGFLDFYSPPGEVGLQAILRF